MDFKQTEKQNITRKYFKHDYSQQRIDQILA